MVRGVAYLHARAGRESRGLLRFNPSGSKYEDKSLLGGLKAESTWSYPWGRFFKTSIYFEAQSLFRGFVLRAIST